MATIRPNLEPPVSTVQAGDGFLLDGATGVRFFAASSVALLDASGNANFFGTTASTSPSTGAVIASGGLGVGGAAWIGGLANVAGVLSAASATATPAGGSTAARLLFGTTSGFGIYYGSGLPTVSAAQGSIYIRSDGSSTSTRLYVNTNGTTGWTNFTSAS